MSIQGLQIVLVLGPMGGIPYVAQARVAPGSLEVSLELSARSLVQLVHEVAELVGLRDRQGAVALAGQGARRAAR